jgi:16S rRNA (guanine966-N2)-methyltransferase
MRIIAGQWRGRLLTAPPGLSTRPTADRVRQALFDMLLHAPWAGPELFAGADVLDGFAGSGALGLEALSRGAAQASFIERDPEALAALRRNVELCRAGAQARIIAGDVLRPPPGSPCRLVFLDPPYGQDLGPRALAALREAGWLARDAVIVLESGRDETVPELGTEVASRVHGAARLTVWRGIG